MATKQYIQDVIGPNVNNYKLSINNSVSYIFQSLNEYFKIDPFVSQLASTLNEGNVFYINLPDFDTKISVRSRLVVTPDYYPECAISFSCDSLPDDPLLLELKLTRLDLVYFSVDEQNFSETSFDYNASHLPAMIFSRCLDSLMKNKIISL